MGVWGTAIFSDDVAADARNEYRGHLEYGLDGPAATDKVLEALRGSDGDGNDDPSVWLGLAAAQVRLGRLEDRVKDRALAIIADGSDLQRWADEPNLQETRRRVLQKLDSALRGPQRTPVKVRRRIPIVCEWAPGEVIGFRGESRTWLLYVRGVFPYFRDEVPLVSALALPFDEALKATADTPYLPTTPPKPVVSCEDCFSFHLSQRDYKSKRFCRTGVFVPSKMSASKPEPPLIVTDLHGLDFLLTRSLKGRPHDYGAPPIMLGTLARALKLRDATIPLIVSTKPPADMPTFNKQWHYAGTRAKLAVREMHVWINETLKGADRENAIKAGVLVALADGGYFGAEYKHHYDIGAAKDAQLPADALDPFLNRRKYADTLVEIVRPHDDSYAVKDA